MSSATGRVATAAAVLVAIVTLAACGSEEKAAGRTPLDLRIGNLVPHTGFLDRFGQPAQQAAELAVDEIRQAATKAGAPHKVTIMHEDDASQPGPATQKANKLVRQGASCMLGPWSGGALRRVLTRVAMPNKVPEIAPGTTGDAFSKAQDLGYLSRTVPPDELQVDALAQLLDEELGGARGKLVNAGALDSTYGKDLLRRFNDAWKGKGGQLGKWRVYKLNEASFEDDAQQLATGDPDAWVFFDFVDTYIQVAEDLRSNEEASFSPKRAFGTDSLATARLGNIGREVSNGFRGVAISAPTQGPAAEEFDRRFKAKGEAERQTFDAQAFDAVVLCYLAAVAAASTNGEDMAPEVQAVSAPPGRKFTWMQLDQAVKALEAGQDIDYDGASGPIDLNEDGDPTAGVYDVYEFRSGKLRVTDKQLAVPERAGGF